MKTELERQLDQIEAIGDDHIGTSAVTPLRADAFEMSNADKLASIQKDVAHIMETLGLDMTDDSLKGTPKRVAKMFVNEIFSGLHPSSKRFELAPSDVVNDISEILSVRTLFTSSGMDMSLDLKPASTWATAIPSFLAVIEQANVELTSPTTMTIVGFFLRHTFSNSIIILAVCLEWESLPTPI